jgi:hypothetical protein
MSALAGFVISRAGQFGQKLLETVGILPLLPIRGACDSIYIFSRNEEIDGAENSKRGSDAAPFARDLDPVWATLCSTIGQLSSL